ncbi:MAG TPA: DNA gyrase inhibitor YacG [Kofleriaceae bacterium]|nr:DNA gyrase inhibitor YacG [Kofleriaceae bacterium]
MKCPTCRAAVQRDGNKHYPFCSERCALVDLGRWLGEEYRVPGDPAPDAANPNADQRSRDEDDAS